MLERFTIQNYRSVAEVTLDLRFPEERAARTTASEETYRRLSVGKRHFLPCIGLWGPNAAGKSNLFRAMGSFAALVSAKGTPDLAAHYRPNRLAAPDKPTEFEAEFCAEDSYGSVHSLVYTLAYDAETIHFEELMLDGETIFRCGGQPAMPLRISAEREGLEAEMTAVVRNTLRCLPSDNAAFEGLGKQLCMLDAQNGVRCETALEDVADIIMRLDVGISDLAVIESPDAPPTVAACHRDERGQPVLFDLEDESDGTRRLIWLVAELLEALKHGQTIVADEMDRSIHPILFRALVKMCISKAYNSGSSQLIFSTHDLPLLDQAYIKPESVAFVSRAGSRTRLRTLRDLTAEDGHPVRSLTAFRKRYLEGRYQNIPYPSL